MTAHTDRSYRWLFWTLALVGFVADQGTKYGIFNALYDGARYGQYGTKYGELELIPGAFQLLTQYSAQSAADDQPLSFLRTLNSELLPEVNTGALFGIGRSSNVLFALVSVLAALAIIVWSARCTAAHDRFLCLTLGLILGGTLGNLYDRVVFQGVRDFLRWYYVVDWPVFNIADCCLVCGAFLLLVQAFFAQPQPVEEPAVVTQQEQPQVAEVK